MIPKNNRLTWAYIDSLGLKDIDYTLKVSHIRAYQIKQPLINFDASV